MITNYLEKEFTLKRNLSQFYSRKRRFCLTFIKNELSNITFKKVIFSFKKNYNFICKKTK